MSVGKYTRHLNETSGTLKNQKVPKSRKSSQNIGTDISENGVPYDRFDKGVFNVYA